MSKEIERIKTIIKEVDPRNYTESIREKKWEYYWTDNVSLVNEMFDIVESLMSEDKYDKFSVWCLKATEENMIDYIKSEVIA